MAQDLGTLPGGVNALARGISSAGVIVGRSDGGTDPNGPEHAVVWKHGTITELGTLPSLPPPPSIHADTSSGTAR